MTKARLITKRRRAESGYAMLTVVFMAALMIIAAAAVQTNILTQGRREKEEELIWRGKQYMRGIYLFQRKNGRFPNSIEELVKPGIGVRYMRKAYKEPMNTVDGSWRLLYVGPAGQIIGSVKANPLGSLFGGVNGPNGSGANPPNGSGTNAPSSDAGKAPGQSGNTGTLSPLQSSAFGSDGTVFGGNIIGVASKINRPSIKVYESGTNYREWEFIYNPAKNLLTQPGSGNPIGGNAGGTDQKKNPDNPPQNPPPSNPQ